MRLFSTVFHRARLRLLPLLTVSALIFPIYSPAGLVASLPTAVTYYIDCNGNDSNNGTSTSTPWRSLVKANRATLAPGDRMLFKRGCTWTGTFIAKWNGTASQNILIGAYGTGALPKIQNGPTDLGDGHHNNVEITGSYQIIEFIETTIVNPPVVPGCQNNPIGFFVGFNFRNPNNTANGGSYNVVRNSKATRHMAGISLHRSTHHNRILNNVLTDNHVMEVLTPVSVRAADDLGAWGIAVRGKYHEIAFNYLSNNNAFCTYDTPPQGNAIELYEAQFTSVHHNTSINDRDFSEIGGTSSMRADTNTFAYNLVISSIRDSHFIIVRGSRNMYGPTYRTTLYNNTVYYTGAESQGIICGAGCSTDILTAKNNIIWAQMKAVFADARFTESNNLYWNTSGQPFVQLQNFNMSPTSRIANPQFIDAVSRNFRLQSSSPAINAGINSGWTSDLDQVQVPQGGTHDLGGFEFVATASIAELLPKLFLPLVGRGP